MASQQTLPHDVIDFVRARMAQIFAFQINLRSADGFRQTFRKIKRRFASDVFFQIISQLIPESGSVLDFGVSVGDFKHDLLQIVGQTDAAEAVEISVCVGIGICRNVIHCLIPFFFCLSDRNRFQSGSRVFNKIKKKPPFPFLGNPRRRYENTFTASLRTAATNFEQSCFSSRSSCEER